MRQLMAANADRDIQAFFDSLAEGQLREMFEHIPDVNFFVKDRQSRLITCNQGMLTSFFGRRHVSEIYGRTGMDFFPESIAGPYLADDQRVMDEGRALIDVVELALSEEGSLSWFRTTKLPLYNRDGEVVGLVGISRVMQTADQRLHPAAAIMPAINHIQGHFREQIRIPELARACHLSVSQLHRAFKEHFRQTPLQFVLKLRMQAACRLLRSSSLSVAEIADECGFSDQNYFARHFRKVVGQTPTGFRKQYR
jgi:AraC-like DNA-binding protein